MHPDVQALLAVQVDDTQVYALEDRLASLAPRLAALEKERGKVASQADRLRGEIAHEESRHREALGRVETHKALLERSQRQYESVTSPREATAASTQLEQTKRMATESERDAVQVASRIGDMRHRLVELETALTEVEERQSTARSELDSDRAAIEADLATAHAKRDAAAKAVPRSLLSQYDRVRARKRADSLVPLRGQSCSACDTAIPTQRRAVLAASGNITVCEGCGALLYAPE
jgi:predicted  nucleic acid-binding Zn-ribbon protein